MSRRAVWVVLGKSSKSRTPSQNFHLKPRQVPRIRRILVSIKFMSAILGPEMAAPILWARGKIAFFLQENPCP